MGNVAPTAACGRRNRPHLPTPGHNQNVEIPADLIFSGRDQDRTGDTRIFSPLLYQLSYPTEMEFQQCIRPRKSPQFPKKTVRSRVDLVRDVAIDWFD